MSTCRLTLIINNFLKWFLFSERIMCYRILHYVFIFFHIDTLYYIYVYHRAYMLGSTINFYQISCITTWQPAQLRGPNQSISIGWVFLFNCYESSVKTRTTHSQSTLLTTGLNRYNWLIWIYMLICVSSIGSLWALMDSTICAHIRAIHPTSRVESNVIASFQRNSSGIDHFRVIPSSCGKYQ